MNEIDRTIEWLKDRYAIEITLAASTIAFVAYVITLYNYGDPLGSVISVIR